MYDTIIAELSKIEKKENVKIVYAVESGSRAWGFPSQDSDYDVRFIYIRPRDFYLTIEEDRDVLEFPINNMLDISGWDIRKSLKLFMKSNPPLSEWLISPILYKEHSGFIKELRNLHSQYFSPKSCAYHYLNMAKNNFRHYLQGEKVKSKKYFYVLRPVLSCLWIEKNAAMPPMEFQKLLPLVHKNKELIADIDALLKRKMSGDELDLEPAIPSIHDFLSTELERLEKSVQDIDVSQKPGRAQLDELFRKTLVEAWD